MSLKDDFETFCNSIDFELSDDMDKTIREITKKLNSKYYQLVGEEEEHMYVVGSMGRNTAVKSSSDLDLLFDLPSSVFSKYDKYESNGQSELLQNVKEALKEHYPKTKIRADGQVVVIEFTKYTVELVPGFRQSDDRFKYPDTHGGGSWKYTDPLSEQYECVSSSNKSNGAYIDFCHIIRKWKNNQGFKLGGLLIDTFVFNNFDSSDFEQDYSYDNYLELFKDVLQYISDLDDNQSYWYALGSNQRVYNKNNGKFSTKASKALSKIQNAEDNNDNMNDVLREILGNEFPESKNQKTDNNVSMALSEVFNNTEEFIENKFPVDIRYSLTIDCKVSQSGFRTFMLRESHNNYIGIKKKLEFYISEVDDSLKNSKYDILWKVRNVGKEAVRRNCIRGQIIRGDHGKPDRRTEHSNFNGKHYVECFLVKNGVCIARDRIDVPINNNF